MDKRKESMMGKTWKAFIRLVMALPLQSIAAEH
jgi:hypothetical protein